MNSLKSGDGGRPEAVRAISTPLVLATVLLLVGCASKPDEEIAAARNALETARTAEADLYSADAYQAASNALKSAEAEIAAQDQKSSFSRNYDKAREWLARAKTQADSAASTAGATKDHVKTEAQTAQAGAQAALDAAWEVLAKAVKAKGARADLDALRSDLTDAQTSFNEAEASYAGGRFMDARNQFNAVRQKAKAVASDIERGTQKKVGKSGLRKWGIYLSLSCCIRAR